MFPVYILSGMFRALQPALWRLPLATSAALLVLLQAPLLLAADSVTQTNSPATVIVVVGAPGEEDYGSKFNEWASRWEKATTGAGAKWIGIGHGKDASTNEAAELKTWLDKESKTGSAELWVVLLGHGTYDGKDSKFNLRGPDISAAELAKLLEPFQRPTAVIAAFSASAPF